MVERQPGKEQNSCWLLCSGKTAWKGTEQLLVALRWKDSLERNRTVVGCFAVERQPGKEQNSCWLLCSGKTAWKGTEQLLVALHLSSRLVYLRDGSAQTRVCAATLR